jgi:hypothetical protein
MHNKTSEIILAMIVELEVYRWLILCVGNRGAS